jgi:hypothetical protein
MDKEKVEEIEAILAADETKAIEWIKNNEDEYIRIAWKILNDYYNKCRESLRDLVFANDQLPTDAEKKKVFANVEESLKNYKFINEAAEFLGVTVSKVETILKKENPSSEEIGIIIKINRLYNMYVKIGHSARITYLANLALENIHKNNDIDQEKKAIHRRTVLLSALLHDIGRFYQAIHYNTFDDGIMRDNEDIIGSLRVDHAVAGYYYGLASALVLLKNSDSSEEAILRFITEAIAAVVVKCHQIANTKMPHFDFDGSYESLKDLDINELLGFINEAYERAKLMNLTIDKYIDSKHKEHIDSFIEELKKEILGKHFFTETNPFELYNANEELEARIAKIIKDMRYSDENAIARTIINTIKDITNIKNLKPSEEHQIVEIINKYSDTLLKNDIASSIERMFIDKLYGIPDSIRYLITSAVAITTNVDKIDIFNQRALGIYPPLETYRLPVINNCPTNDELLSGCSLIDILNNHFKFNIDKHHIVMDKRLIRTLKHLNERIYKVIDDIIVEDYGPEYSILNEENNTKEFTVRENDELYVLLNMPWLTLTNKIGNYCEEGKEDKIDIKELKVNKDIRLLLAVGIDVNDLQTNLIELGYDKEEQLEYIRSLLITPGLEKRFKLEKENQLAYPWINLAQDTDHIIYNNFLAIIWHINQFIMVNMRSRDSLEFIKEYKLLEKMKEKYLETDPLLGELLKEYIDYCIDFINYTIEVAKSEGKDSLDDAFMGKMRTEVFENKTKDNNYSSGK